MKKSAEQINNVLIVGCGTLGLRIGLQFAISGYQVSCYDLNEEVLEQARNIQDKILASLVRQDKIEEQEIGAIQARISWSPDLKTAARDIDLVSESVPENLELKKKVWQQIGPLCPNALLTTNTSYLLPSQFADETGAPERFCAYHFHDVFNANVVDIMPHPGTEERVVEVLKSIAPKIWQIPVVLRQETPGYLFNAMLDAILGRAASLVYRGVSSVEEVDKSWMGNFKLPVGPFGMMDAIGLETVWHVASNLRTPQGDQFAAFVNEYVQQGKLGVKTGEGFYSYPNPAYQREDFLS